MHRPILAALTSPSSSISIARDVSTYFTNLRIVCDEFKHSQPIAWLRCKMAYSSGVECTMQILIGLNSSYFQVQSSILSMARLTSLSKVFSLIIQEERQRNIDGLGPLLLPLQVNNSIAAADYYAFIVVKQTTQLIDVFPCMVFPKDLAVAGASLVQGISILLRLVHRLL